MVEEQVEEKKTTKRAPAVSAARMAALEGKVAALEAYIRTFDMFLATTMISNTVDPSAHESLRELAATIND